MRFVNGMSVHAFAVAGKIAILHFKGKSDIIYLSQKGL